MDELSLLRKKVLFGNFIGSDILKWKAPRAKLVVFVSSTFTDTQAERNILLEDILPDLRKESRLFGAEISLVDMRFGQTIDI